MYDVFPQSVTILNVFGILFAGFLMLKGALALILVLPTQTRYLHTLSTR